MQKTLGGDRLGSGSKQKVHLKNYERSTHDLGRVWRSSMAAGTLVPFLTEVALPGDTFDINLNCDIQTHPTIGPLFGSYKVQLDVFQCPIRLYHKSLHNNTLGIGLDMSKIILPQLLVDIPPMPATTTDVNTSQINPSCILHYLGISGFGQTRDDAQTRYFNAVPFIAYWDIFKNYYANKQETNAHVIHTPLNDSTLTVTSIDVKPTNTGTATVIPEAPTTGTVATSFDWRINIAFSGATPKTEEIIFNTFQYGDLNGTQISDEWQISGAGVLSGIINDRYTFINWRYRDAGDISIQKPETYAFPLTNIDEMRTAILAHDPAIPFAISQLMPLAPYNLVLSTIDTGRTSQCSQEGLALKTYQSDLFNNWINTEWIDGTNGISAVTAIDTTGGSFTIDTLNLSKKVYDMLNRIAVSGGTYDDWLDAVYTHERYTRAETPMYMGGLSKELVFQAVTSNSGTMDQPLGTLAGKGILNSKHKGGHVTIKVDEPSYIMGIISLTPRIDYSQGNRWDTHLRTMDDLHKPALDEIGFQELITEQMAWWDTTFDGTNWATKSAGKQPAWINYMTAYNETHGNFAIANNEMFMTLNRRYETEDTGTVYQIKDLTTYVDPSKYNFIFAQTSIDSQNFWVQIATDITARRKMSARVMPNL